MSSSSSKNDELRKKTNQLMEWVDKLEQTEIDDSIEIEPPETKKPKLSLGSSASSSSSNKNEGDGKFISEKNMPPKEMTGVSIFLTKLCASISSRLYNIDNNIEMFNDLVPKEYSETMEIIKYSSNGMYSITNVPYVIVVTGATMIIGFRGTHGALDLIHDLGFYLSSSFRWSKVGKVVKVFGGMIPVFENFMVENEQLILKTIEEQNITELLLTGHSLGGGISQVGQLWLVGSMNEEYHAPHSYKQWEELKDKVTVRTVAFEAPQTTAYLQRGINDDIVVAPGDYDVVTKGAEFIEKCGSTMCTTSFGMDVVPRLGGYTREWALEFIDAVLNLKKPIGKVPLLEQPGWLIVKLFLKKINTDFWPKAKDSLLPLMECAKAYQHIGKIINYESADSAPQVYINDILGNGLNLSDSYVDGLSSSSSPPRPRPPQYCDIEFKFPEDDLSIVEAVKWFMANHMFIISDQGLSFK